ncbi:MAG: Rhodanese domain protein [Ignavibacteria bacterium]|nr:Rhodanese domain protein [Ignavibacteria bacterium]
MMLRSRKKLFYEIILISLIAASMGFLYNFFLQKPVPWIYQKPIQTFAGESLLFGNQNSHSFTEFKKVDSPVINRKVKNDSVATTRNLKNHDTIKIALEMPINEILSVTYEQLIKALNRSNFVLIDARDKDKYEAGHIESAINISPLWPDNDYIPKIMGLPRDKTIICYCDGGTCDLSHELAKVLNEAGFKRVFIYIGGWDEWLKKRKS